MSDSRLWPIINTVPYTQFVRVRFSGPAMYTITVVAMNLTKVVSWSNKELLVIKRLSSSHQLIFTHLLTDEV